MGSPSAGPASPSMSVASVQSSPSRRPPLRSKSKSLSLPPLSLHRMTPASPSKRLLTPTTPYNRPAYTMDTPGGSRLPATDSMSYFPPFEEMGSAAEVSAAAGPSGTHRSDSDETGSVEAGTERQHGKNKSLGSIANLVAWATFSPTTEPLPRESHPSPEATRTPRSSSPRHERPELTVLLPQASDSERLEALNRRFDPARSKRRAAAQIPQEGEAPAGTISLLGLTTGIGVPAAGPGEVEGSRHKARRMTSEAEVERIIRSAQRPEGAEGGRAIDEEGAVERLVGWVPPKATTRQQRDQLTLPLPSLMLPNWRFPIPSPPLTSLSMPIPSELFQFEISNPASASSSPTKHSASFSDFYLQQQAVGPVDMSRQSTSPTDERELDEIEGSLLWSDADVDVASDGSTSSGSSAASAAGILATPVRISPKGLLRHAAGLALGSSPTKRDLYDRTEVRLRRYSLCSDSGDTTLDDIASVDASAEQDGDDGDEPFEMILPEKLKLRRTSSSGSKASCDSARTVRPRGKEGEITPRAGKGWRAAYVS